MNSIWVGGTDQFKERNWTWTDCSPWNFTRWGVRAGIDGVDFQQPDDSQFKDGNGENCLIFHGKRAINVDWNDVACYLRKREFVCAKNKCPGAETHFCL